MPLLSQDGIDIERKRHNLKSSTDTPNEILVGVSCYHCMKCSNVAYSYCIGHFAY